ncbi:unnamed protein product [Wuchereria bancrofti]|uniref:Uncharacterized protein n=1 Tax=Wuchereria bancrofti TaxID=6293 RepID=A0A3P7EBX8_WUCBA|nr:unnamed protein product [Wuchereria bancrofti]
MCLLIINMELCMQASELANNVVFNAILIVVIIISATAIVVEIWTTNRILLHRNTRILIITHQLWLILHCAARLFLRFSSAEKLKFMIFLFIAYGQ